MIFWIGALLLLQLSRLFFLLRSSASFEGLQFSELARAFLWGFRFDASAIAYLILTSLALEVVCFVFRIKSGQFWARLLKVCGFSLFFLLSLVDAEYFNITHKRLDASISSIGWDIRDQLRQFATHYTYIAVCSLLVFFIMWHLSGRKKIERGSRIFTPFRKIISFCLLVPLLIFVARGGIQEKPIKVSSAIELGDSKLVDLALSTPFVLMQTYKQNSKLVTYKDFDKTSAALALSTERPHTGPYHSLISKNPTDNVLLIILESFSNEYSSATPFLNSLKEKGISFENHYANGRTSIEAVPALFASLPSLLKDPYITSSFISSKLHGLPSLDSTGARDFMFFHGARKGSMYFDSFTSFLGFNKYYGKEDYDGDPSALYDWGVHDHAFLDFTGKILSQEKKPFVASVFTLSSHQPFEIPKSFSTSLAEARTPFIRSLRYADKSLQLFFEKYKDQPWFKNTLFILTGDHTSQCSTQETCSHLGSFRVPLILYHGSKNLGGLKVTKVTQHADIPFSIADYLNLDASHLIPLGHSVLDASDQGVALFSEEEEFQALYGDAFYRLKGSDLLRCPANMVDEKTCSSVDPIYFPGPYKYLRALRSYFTQSLNERNFY